MKNNILNIKDYKERILQKETDVESCKAILCNTSYELETFEEIPRIANLIIELDRIIDKL